MMYEQQQLKALIDTAVDGIMSISHDGRVMLYNPAATGMFGYEPSEVIGQDVAMLMPDHHAHRHQSYIDAYMDTGVARIIGIGRIVEGKRKDGTVFPMSLSVGEFADDGSRYFVGIVRDLSRQLAERKRAQDLQDQLETIGRHSAVTEMGAALAHELNQPLTAIDLFLVAAERQLDTNPEKAKELFLRVRKEAKRAGGIVRRIRQMVERSDGERTVIFLDHVIKSAVELCRVVEGHDDILVVEDIPSGSFYADEIQVRMILINLIKNALDATDGQANRKVVIRATLDDVARIDVLDNGPGVAPDMENSLFEPFASSKKKGLGIGLSICRTIAETHGGHLRYIQPKDQVRGLGGAQFHLCLPTDQNRD